MSVLVTNARNRIAYNVVRSLGQKGVAVHVADFVPRSMSFISRYAKSSFLYPSPFREPEAFLRCMTEHIARLKPDVLIPVYEETFLLARHKDLLSPLVSFVLPDYSQILVAHNKHQWEPVARRLGIPVPPTYVPEELRRGGTQDLRYPVLIKPKQGGGSWGIREVASAQLLRELLERTTWADKPWNQFFIQERIAGHTHCVAMLFNKGALRAKVAYRQLRDYPSTGGQATRRVSQRHESAETHFERLLEELDWHGVCQADFIVEEKSGVPYLIDINPRLWGSLTQAIASGVDFPYLIYRLALDGDVSPVATFKTGIETRWLGGDVAALPSRLRSAQSKREVLKDFFFPTVPTALFDDFSLADPLPFMSWCLDSLTRAVKFRSVQPRTHDSLDGLWE
jgi:predicted ATP-grasp superfamily ATP-dependent carboligase